MDPLIGLLLVALVVAAVYGGHRVQRFGGVLAAFSPKDKQQRVELAKAQNTLRRLLRQRDAELAPGRKAAEAAVTDYRTRVQTAEAALRAVQDPGTGALIQRLGPVALHEHVLWLDGSLVPLAGLQVSVEPTYTTSALVLQFPDGQRRSVPYSTEVRADAQNRPTREFDDAQVLQFRDAIHNAVLDEQRFRTAQPQLVAAARADLERRLADTSLMTEELSRYADARLAARTTDDALSAHERLCELEDAWLARPGARKKLD